MCVTACSLIKSGTCGPAASRIWALHFSEQARYVPLTCTQCAEAWCVSACPANAIAREGESETVRVNDDLCVGCRACTMACPFGAMLYHPPSRVAIKCDECGGDPACVRICPTGAIRFEDPDAAAGRTRQAWAAFLLASTAEKPTPPSQ